MIEIAARRRPRAATRVTGRGVLCVALLVLVSLGAPAPVGAAGGFAVASGFASYQPGGGETTPTPVQFDTLTLASGGTAAASTLSITGQPSSGTATADTSSGLVTYDPTASTSGDQIVTFALCEAGETDCQTSTLEVAPATDVNDAIMVPVLGGYAAYGTAYAALAPSSAAQGATFTESFAPASFTAPASLDLNGVPWTVHHLDSLTYILPVPADATYVGGSAQVVGGDAATAGQATVTPCTTTGGTDTCTATSPASTFPTDTTTPYLELQLSPGVQVPGGSAVTVPTVVAQFTASGPTGSTIEPQVTEWDAGADVTVLGSTLSTTLSGYPVSAAFTGGTTPPAAVADPLSTTTIAPPPPTVSGLSPASGPEAGGTAVTVTGTNLAGATAVDFGAAGAAYTVDSSTQITATSPPGTGTVDVTVTTPGGESSTSPPDQYTYLPAAPTVTGVHPRRGPVAGGTPVTLTGTGFTGATAVLFGHTPATDVTVVTPTEMTVTSPHHAAGRVHVRVTAPGGASAASPANRFTFVPRPTVASVSPSAGPTAGGTSVTITGTGYTGATAVDFGAGQPAASYTVDSSTQITATSPAHAAGRVNVRVTTPGGISAVSAADRFAY